MPDNWINRRLLTDETEIVIDGVKVHDLSDCSQEDQVEVLETNHPKLFSKLDKVEGVAYTPYIIRPEGSPVGYKIIADAT